MQQVVAKVKWFNETKGFGFLTAESPQFKGQDIFAHYSQIQTKGFRTLVEGEPVTCEVVTEAKGLQAKNIVRTHAE